MPWVLPLIHATEFLPMRGTGPQAVRYADMRKKLRLSRSLRHLPLVIAAGAGALVLHACGKAEAEPKADPAEVQAYLKQLEAEERLIVGDPKPKKPSKTIVNLVQGAAVRAPSEASLNRIETAVAANL